MQDLEELAEIAAEGNRRLRQDAVQRDFEYRAYSRALDAEVDAEPLDRRQEPTWRDDFWSESDWDASGFEEKGERVVCNLSALLGKGGMELVEAVVELPESPPARSPSAARAARAIATRRGGQRWSSLVSAPTSRVARILRPVLGEALWCRFVLHANAYYKDAFVAAFDGPVLSCVGRGDTPCPRGFCIDLSVSADGLRHLHLDHEQDLQVTCDMWK